VATPHSPAAQSRHGGPVPEASPAPAGRLGMHFMNIGFGRKKFPSFLSLNYPLYFTRKNYSKKCLTATDKKFLVFN
jgi:hypothetical protein